METTPSLSTFESAYEANTAPWVIGEPQPAIVALERDGWIRGSVLDVGCGSGEHTIQLAGLGYDVRGVDLSERALAQARANAAERGIATSFEVADALDLGDEPRYDTVIDSALFHIFDPTDRATYVRSLHAACRPGALVHVLALAEDGPSIGPEVSDATIRDAFGGDQWVLEDLRPSRYRVYIGQEDAERLDLPVGENADMTAWLARARRL